MLPGDIVTHIDLGPALLVTEHDLLLLLPVAAGDTVSNMDLGPALAAHKERADRDKDAIMTMVGGWLVIVWFF